MARKVDPTGGYSCLDIRLCIVIDCPSTLLGARTIGVVTKLDLMDAGTNALDILTGRVFPLKLGFVGLVNRSQQDILTNKPIEEALKSEQEFFQRHPAYRSIASRCGANFLAKHLNSVCQSGS